MIIQPTEGSTIGCISRFTLGWAKRMVSKIAESTNKVAPTEWLIWEYSSETAAERTINP